MSPNLDMLRSKRQLKNSPVSIDDLMSKKSRERELIDTISTFLERPIGVGENGHEAYNANAQYYTAYLSRSFTFDECSETKQEERLDELEEIVVRFKNIFEKKDYADS